VGSAWSGVAAQDNSYPGERTTTAPIGLLLRRCVNYIGQVHKEDNDTTLWPGLTYLG